MPSLIWNYGETTVTPSVTMPGRRRPAWWWSANRVYPASRAEARPTSRKRYAQPQRLTANITTPTNPSANPMRPSSAPAMATIAPPGPCSCNMRCPPSLVSWFRARRGLKARRSSFSWGSSQRRLVLSGVTTPSYRTVGTPSTPSREPLSSTPCPRHANRHRRCRYQAGPDRLDAPRPARGRRPRPAVVHGPVSRSGDPQLDQWVTSGSPDSRKHGSESRCSDQGDREGDDIAGRWQLGALG